MSDPSQQAPLGSSSKATLFEKPSTWNNTADDYLDFADTTIKYGIDALEIVGVSAGDKLLDVATGPGHLALYAASEKGATVDAIDFASENIAILKRSLESHPLAVTGYVMDGQQLDFPDCQFDVVSSCFGVFAFPDYMMGVSEMLRVTKPGGKVAVVAWAEMHRAVMRPWMQLFERHFPEVLPLPMPPGIAKMSTMEGMKAVLMDGGFVDGAVSEVAHSVTVADPKVFADLDMQNPVLGIVQERLTPERCKELVPRFIDLLESEYKHGDAIAFDAVAIIGCAGKPPL
eukprot:jgi/Ulvmu1/3851/UM018_0070.1